MKVMHSSLVLYAERSRTCKCLNQCGAKTIKNFFTFIQNDELFGENLISGEHGELGNGKLGVDFH